MAVKLYHGDIVYTPSADALAVYENSYIAVDSGKVEGDLSGNSGEIYACRMYRLWTSDDYSGFFGSACPWCTVCAERHWYGLPFVKLAEQLYISAQEAGFKDMSYAKKCYGAFVDDMIRHGTFHANVFWNHPS
ncbi:MAG: hypothetical protein ACLTDC_02655 [Lachnospiraceae bacterium]